MGKILIIRGADFSEVAVEKVAYKLEGPTIKISSEGRVTITDDSAYAIYYTTDGSTPTVSSTEYSSGFSVELGTTVKAISAYADSSYSYVVSKKYVTSDQLLYLMEILNKKWISIPEDGIIDNESTIMDVYRYSINNVNVLHLYCRMTKQYGVFKDASGNILGYFSGYGGTNDIGTNTTGANVEADVTVPSGATNLDLSIINSVTPIVTIVS